VKYTLFNIKFTSFMQFSLITFSYIRGINYNPMTLKLCPSYCDSRPPKGFDSMGDKWMYPIQRTSSGVICNTCISGYLFFMVSSAVASWHSPYDFFYNSCLKPTKDSGCVHWNQADVLGIHIYNTTICGIIVYNFGNNRRYFNRLLLL